MCQKCQKIRPCLETILEDNVIVFRAKTIFGKLMAENSFLIICSKNWLFFRTNFKNRLKTVLKNVLKHMQVELMNFRLLTGSTASTSPVKEAPSQYLTLILFQL